MFKPNTTVAIIVRYKERYLMVEEICGGRQVFNQPAGHLEQGENLIEAAERELFEETGLQLSPQALVGIYLFKSAANDVTYLRFCFCIELDSPPPPCRPQDDDILACHWFTRGEIEQQLQQMRSGLVIQCFDDFAAGKRISLDYLHSYLQGTV